MRKTALAGAAGKMPGSEDDDNILTLDVTSKWERSEGVGALGLELRSTTGIRMSVQKS